MKTIPKYLLSAAILCANIFQPALANDSAEFATAVELWTSGNDRESLAALAKLARDGSSEARMLLARIDVMDKGPSPYRLSLSKEESRKLFKSNENDGVFRRSWLAVEADADNIKAIALLKSRMPTVDINLIKTLHDLGETEATDHPTRILALYGNQEVKRSLLDSDYLLPELRPYLAYLTEDPEPRGDGMAALRSIIPDLADEISSEDTDALGMAGILALGYGYGDIKWTNKWRQPVANWLLQSPSTRPIANLCKAECPDEVSDCVFAVMALTGGYYEVIRLDTPLQSTISQDQFISSPRAQLMALRRAALTRSETNSELANVDDIASMSVCAANRIDLERKKYQ